MSVLTFENKISKLGLKQGNMVADASGYYQVILGAFGTHNSRGDFYLGWEGNIKNVFASSSELMNRINSGKLYSEWGHPKFTAGMTERDYLVKLLIMHEENIAAHIKKIEIDDSYTMPDGKKAVVVHGFIKPFGPNKDCVQDAIDAPDMNLCWSLRSLSMDKPDRTTGRLIKDVLKIVTWDAVLEPGISIADKYSNPSLESHHFTASDIDYVIEQAASPGIGLESAIPELRKLKDYAGQSSGRVSKEMVINQMRAAKVGASVDWT